MRPVMEKRGFELRHIVYIIILIVCLIAIGIAVYMQFFKDEKIGLILGITKEQEDEEIKQLKENFLNIFDNSIDVVSKYNGNIKKIKGQNIPTGCKPCRDWRTVALRRLVFKYG